jgi:hypothetical protein
MGRAKRSVRLPISLLLLLPHLFLLLTAHSRFFRPMTRIANTIESSSETLVAPFEGCWSVSSVGLFDSYTEGFSFIPFSLLYAHQMQLPELYRIALPCPPTALIHHCVEKPTALGRHDRRPCNTSTRTSGGLLPPQLLPLLPQRVISSRD